MAGRRDYTEHLDEVLTDDAEALAYLNAALAEDDPEVFPLALRDVARTREGGLAALAEAAQPTASANSGPRTAISAGFPASPRRTRSPGRSGSPPPAAKIASAVCRGRWRLRATFAFKCLESRGSSFPRRAS